MRNKVSKECWTVKHAVVGEAINVYGDPGQLSTLIVAPAERPGCDILELDCEGAEIAILREYDHSPSGNRRRDLWLRRTARPWWLRSFWKESGYTVEEWGIAEPRLSEKCETYDIRVLFGERN